jgi:hypothetical protein
MREVTKGPPVPLQIVPAATNDVVSHYVCTSFIQNFRLQILFIDLPLILF